MVIYLIVIKQKPHYARGGSESFATSSVNIFIFIHQSGSNINNNNNRKLNYKHN